MYIYVQIEEKMKYAKWKAVEIDRCLKNGITPTPGPPGEQMFDEEPAQPPPMGFNVQPPASDDQPPASDDQPGPSWEPTPSAGSKPTPKPRHMPASQFPQPQATSSYDDYGSGASGGASVWDTGSLGPGIQLGPQQISKAQKLCKFASSALEYEDVPGAIEFLGKAMKLLQTGKEEG